jgi:dihydropteroate synthase
MLAGQPLAFTHLEIIQPFDGEDARRQVLTLADFRRWKEALPPPAQERLSRILNNLQSLRPGLAAFSQAEQTPATVIMGIINVTPDSFSDGGHFLAKEAAITEGGKLVEAGADCLDVGGVSTRPGAAPVALEEELNRVLPVIEGLKNLGVPLSIDTRSAVVMAEATRAGARIINDVSALTSEEASLAAAGASGAAVVLMHARGDPRTMQDNPVYGDVLLDVYDYLEGRIEAAMAAGIPRNRLVVDPGIGFGKNLEHNLALLSGLSLFHGLGVPVLLGASRKSFIGRLSGESNPAARLPGSLAAGLQAITQGVQILRVHDVGEMVQARKVFCAILQAE